MNAQTSLPAWERYRAPLHALRPGYSEHQTRYRCGIMMMRDQAHQLMEHDNSGAIRAVWLMANECFLRPMNDEQVRDCWGSLGLIMMHARKLERMADELTGERNARG